MKIGLLFLLALMSSVAFADTTNWMSQIPNDRIFNQLMIPGTHDSGTYAITKDSKFSLSPDDALPIWVEAISNILPPSLVQAITANWSKTQPKSITDQLNAGIRYFDCRVDLFPTDNHFYLSHTLLGVPLADALQQVQEFVAQHPSEIILLDMNHVFGVNNSDQQTQLIYLLQTYLGNVLIPNTLSPTATMGALRASHGNVIVLMDINQSINSPALDAFATANIWHESAINSPWPNVSTVADLKSALDAEMLARSKTYLSDPQLFVLQMIQTESTDDVIDGIINSKDPDTIKTYEAPVNADLNSWLMQYIGLYGVHTLNIVIQDWFANPETLVAMASKYDSQELTHPQNTNRDALALKKLKAWFRVNAS